MEEAVAIVLGELGGCGHVVYAAGVGSGKFGFPFWNLQPGDWDRVLQINLGGAVNVAHAFAPHMVDAAARHDVVRLVDRRRRSARRPIRRTAPPRPR